MALWLLFSTRVPGGWGCWLRDIGRGPQEKIAKIPPQPTQRPRGLVAPVSPELPKLKIENQNLSSDANLTHFRWFDAAHG
jgi:hypothetical protein